MSATRTRRNAPSYSHHTPPRGAGHVFARTSLPLLDRTAEPCRRRLLYRRPRRLRACRALPGHRSRGGYRLGAAFVWFALLIILMPTASRNGRPPHLLAALRAAAAMPADAVPALPRGAVMPGPGAAPNLAAVSFPPASAAGRVRHAITALGYQPLDAIDGLPGRTVYVVRLASGVPLAQGLTRLAALPGAIAAEPVYRDRYLFHPNDPLYQSEQGYLRMLGAEQAWDMQLGDPSVVVAVVDSGVALDHPDLQGAIWTNPAPGAGDCGSDDLHGCNVLDPQLADPACPNIDDGQPVPNGDVRPTYFHGTFVAGIIAARANNGIGIAGVAPNVTIMPVRAGDCDGVYTTAEAKGILYAARHGARIINLSLGEDNCLPAVSYVRDAIAEAERLGALVVAAAGNAGQNCISAPANVPGVLAVGATAADGRSRASFSDWGPEVALAAPGVGIAGTRPNPNNPYGLEEGTSFSAPIVAGVAALLLSQNPLLTPALLRDVLQAGAMPLPDGDTPGWAGAGRVDMLGALQAVPAAFYGHVVEADGTPYQPGATVTALIDGQMCGTAQSYTAVDGSTGYVLFVQPATVLPGCGTAGSSVTIAIAGVPVATATWAAAAAPLDLDVP